MKATRAQVMRLCDRIVVGGGRVGDGNVGDAKWKSKSSMNVFRVEIGVLFTCAGVDCLPWRVCGWWWAVGWGDWVSARAAWQRDLLLFGVKTRLPRVSASVKAKPRLSFSTQQQQGTLLSPLSLSLPMLCNFTHTNLHAGQSLPFGP